MNQNKDTYRRFNERCIKIPQGRKRETARKVRINDITSGKFFKEEGFTPNYILTPFGLRVSRTRIIATIVDLYQNEDGSYGAITLDDGTGTIRAKFFQDLEMMEDLEEGQIVEFIGKVKKYDDEIYLVPETTVEKSPNQELLRALEYKKFKENWKSIVERAKVLKEDDESEEDIMNELKAENLSEADIEAIIKYMGMEDEIQSQEPSKGKEEVTKESGQQNLGGKEEKEVNEPMEKKVLDIIEDKDSGEGADYSDIIENVDAPEEELEDVINDLLSDGTCYEPRPGKIKKL